MHKLQNSVRCMLGNIDFLLICIEIAVLVSHGKVYLMHYFVRLNYTKIIQIIYFI